MYIKGNLVNDKYKMGTFSGSVTMDDEVLHQLKALSVDNFTYENFTTFYIEGVAFRYDTIGKTLTNCDTKELVDAQELIKEVSERLKQSHENN